MHSQNNVNDTIQKVSSLGRFFEYFCCHKNNEMIQITDYYYKKNYSFKNVFILMITAKKQTKNFSLLLYICQHGSVMQMRLNNLENYSINFEFLLFFVKEIVFSVEKKFKNWCEFKEGETVVKTSFVVYN